MAKILVVEDESVVAWHVQETLQKLGHEVVKIATTGRDAILITAQTKPHLVLMDICLQGDIDGIAAAKTIYFELDVPVVYLTAHADEQTLQRATETSPFGYLVKPFQEADLHSTIKITLQRHQLEKALKETQQWYATTLISIGDATIATDIDGFVTFMNPTAEILTGWNQEQALGAFITQVLDFVDEETREPIENPLLAAMCRGDTMTLPDGSMLCARDGAEHLIGDSASPIRNRDGQITGGVMVFQDLSSRRCIDTKLQQQNDWLEHNQDQLTLQLHQRTEQLQQAISCTQVLQRVLEQSRETGDRLQVLQLTLKELGQTLEADYCWATLHDEAYEIATIVCEHRGQGVEALDSLVGNQIKLEDFSRFYLRLFQRDCWVDPSPDLLPLIYRSLLDSTTQILICPIEDERRVIGEVGILIQGKPIWSRLQAELVAQVVSQAMMVLGQAQLDRVIQTQVGELQCLNSVKDDFLCSLSHELQTPLTNMRMAVEMLQCIVMALKQPESQQPAQSTELLWDKLEQYFQILQEEWQEEFELINNLLKMSSSRALVSTLLFSEISLQTLLLQMVDRFKEDALSRQQVLTWNAAIEMPLLRSHLPTLEQILTELLTDALKLTPANGQIGLHVQATANDIIFVIRNTGADLKVSEQEQIVQSFSTFNAAICESRGSGLGLALVEKLVRSLEGSIRVERQPGEMAFIMTLPIVPTSKTR